MVFESLAEIILNKYLEKFFFGISSKNIQFQILDGKFVLSNIGLQPDLITNLNLPIELRYSYVERVQIHIPWRKEQVSLTINISNIYVLVTDSGTNFDVGTIFMKSKEAVIESAIKQFKSNLQRESKKDYGFVERLLLNLLDNVNIKVQCIHFRYENKSKNYSFGIKINEVSAKTVNEIGEPTFFNRQKTKEEYVRYVLQIDFMGFYFNSKQDYFLSNKTLAEITDDFNRLSNVRFNNNSQFFDSQENMDRFSYILTISLKTQIKKNINALERLNQNKEEKYLFECDINLKNINSHITHEQYYDIFDLINVFSEYSRMYQQYGNEHHIINNRQKKGKDIVQLLQKKKKKIMVGKMGQKQKQTLKSSCQKYLVWIFRHAQLEIIKRKFIKQAIKKQISVKNFTENKTMVKMLSKIDNDKLKYWILISLYYRKMFEQKCNVLLRFSEDKINRFAQKYIDRIQNFNPYQFQEQINKMRQTSSNKFQVFLKLNISIESLNFQISKQNTFGVGFDISKLKVSLIVREKNYQLILSMLDLQANVFNCKKAQKLKTYVPIIKRNCVFDDHTDLLQIKYERNPLGKPFVFTEVQVQFESLQFTIYPQAFKHFYQILLGGKQSQKKTKSKNKKKKQRENVGQRFDQFAFKQYRLQKTVIKGKVKSPWVVLPLSTNNDMSKDCWVVRLGDFYINTLDYDNNMPKQQALYYELYRLELKRFEVSYFTSINYFHNWQKFNQNQERLHKIKSFSNQKIITMISPLSCFVDFSMLRNNLPNSIKDRKHRFIFQISIDQINIKMSKFLLTKMKYRFDVFDENKQQLNQFIQTNVANIREQNDLSGFCKISYDKIKKINFYCVLKDNFMYFFINQTYHKYHFFVNLTEVAIRLVSNQIQNFNQDKQKMICFYLDDRQKHQNWRKKIIHLINRKDRKMDVALVTSARNNRQSERSLSIQIKQQQIKKINKSKMIKSKGSLERDEKEEEDNAETSSSSWKLNMTFLMNKLSIRLLDEKDEQFLDCLFSKATFVYEVLRSKEMQFSLKQWIVNQTDKKQVFVSSNSFFKEEEKIDQSNIKNTFINFLDIRFVYNQITGELESIVIKVQKLFLAWKVELFTKILLFFYYQESAGDAPSPVNPNKRQMEFIINFKSFTFYAYFNQILIALGKLQQISLRYFQNNILQSFDFKCMIFELDKYVGGDRHNRMPMIQRKTDVDDMSLENSLTLFYILRRKETQGFQEIQRLKAKLGDDVLVSQLTCNWKDSIIYFQNQLTFRLLNFILSKILGTVVSKFKKREYSANYIFQALKIRKVSTFDVRLQGFQFRMPPHQRGFREYCLYVDLMQVKRNLDPVFLPTEVEVPTIREKLIFLWESMVFNVTKARICYKVGQEPPVQMHGDPFNLNFIYSKLNFQKEYFVILKHHDDINRKAILDLVIEQPVIVEAHKIMFVTFLQLFYQNLKHKDGMAEKFQPSLNFPSLREYNIHIQKIGFNMCHYNDKTNKMEAFSINTVNQLKISYEQVGTKSKIGISGLSIRSEGELGVYSLDEEKKNFSLQIHSQEGQMKVVINAQYYAIEVNLDNVNNIVEFINYDNDYVANKIMPKKASSWQYVNVFTKKCELRLGELHAAGEFYISYLKGMKNDIETEAKKYLLTAQQLQSLDVDSGNLNWGNLVDKEIKVNGEELRLSINGDHIGKVSNFCFNRMDITSKSTNRRFKRQRVLVGDGMLHIQLVDLATIYKVYNTYIRKNPKFQLRTFYQPWDKLPPKEKAIEKRSTEVQIQGIAINIIPNLSIDTLLYLKINLSFPLIVYRTYLDEQEVIVNIKFGIVHNKDRLKQVDIGGCRLFKLRYMNFKERKEKWIQILNAKNIMFQLHDISSKVISNVMEEVQSLKTATRKCIHFNKQLQMELVYEVAISNETNSKMKININNMIVVVCEPNTVTQKEIDIDQMLTLFNRTDSFIEITEDNREPIRKTNKQIYLNTVTVFNKNSLMVKAETNKAIFIYRHPFRLTNKSTSNILYKVYKKLLKPSEALSFNPTSNSIQIQLKSGNWSNKSSIDLKKDSQIIGDGCFVVLITHQLGETLLTIKDRFILKHLLPVSVQLQDKEFNSLNQASLGFVPQGQRECYPVKIEGVRLLFNLTKQQKNILFQKKVQANILNKIQYQTFKCPIMTLLNTSNSQNTITLFNSYSLKNECDREVVFSWSDAQYILGPKQSLISSDSFSNLNFKDNGMTVPVQLKAKDKFFYSQFFKFSLINKLQNRVSIIKIEPKYVFFNKSNETIQIIKLPKHNQIVRSHQYSELFQNALVDNTVTLVFGKYHKKQIHLGIKGINYLQMEDLFFKVTVVEKDESIMIILQDSKVGHLIINKLSDITLFACSYLEQESLMHRKSASLSPNSNKKEDYIYRPVMPNSEQFIGIMNWNNQIIELEFYYDLKNVEFKQKFLIDFQKLSYKYSQKHQLLDQKNHKINFILAITLQKSAEDQFTITVIKEKDYESLAIQKLKFSIFEVSCTFVFSPDFNDSITLQCYKANIIREKGVQLQDFDIQVQKLFVREGKNISILNALKQSKFLNCHLILSKTLRGVFINNFMLKLTPFQITCREKAIYMILEKIVEVRAENSKKKYRAKGAIKPQNSNEPSKLSYKDLSLLKESIELYQSGQFIRESILNEQVKELVLQKEWKDQIAKLVKGKKILIINNLEVSQTSIFLTYTKQQYRPFDEKIINDPIIKYMLVIPSISQLKVAIPHLKISSFEGETKVFAKELIRNLRQSIGTTILSSLSSLPLFDSPIIAIDGLYKYIDGMLSIQ